MVPGQPGVGEGEDAGRRESLYREIMASRSDPSTLYSLLGMRLSEEAEVEGLDFAEHSEAAYNN